MTLTITSEVVPLTPRADGVVLVGETRVPLDSVLTEFKQGATAEEIAVQFDSLKLADIYAAIAFYLRHQNEVEAYLQERKQISEQVREENERRFPSQGLRDRLLARRQEKD